MSSAGLRCPLCGSWYTDDPKMHSFWIEGEVCENRAGTGPNPDKCSNEHSCSGKLVPDTPELAVKFRKTRGY